MIDATPFPDPDAALVAVLQRGRTGTSGAMVSNQTPSPIPVRLVTVGPSGGGSRDWGEAAANEGINVFAATDSDCRDLVQMVQDDLAEASDDLIEVVRVPVGGTPIPRQSPPFQRYFLVTVWLRGQADLS